MKYYRAFSLLISSEITMDVLPSLDSIGETPDVRIIRGDTSIDPPAASKKNDDGYWYSLEEQVALFNARDDLWFRVENGNTIIVYAQKSVPDGLLQAYILGRCFGAVLQQRDFFLLHGSCVCCDGFSIMFIGDSGCGKSTLAREFICNGWNLVTDDVSAINFLEDGSPFVLPSYPSQKLWQDTIERYSVDYADIKPLWQEERKEKYHADVSSYFSNSEIPLRSIFWIIKGKGDYFDGCQIQKIDGFATVEVLMRNRYCSGFRCGTDKKNLLFQQCINLSSCISSYCVIRDTHVENASELYRIIDNVIREEK